MELTSLTAAELSVAIHARDISCREVMAAFLVRIAAYNPALNAIVNLRDGNDLLTEAGGYDDERFTPAAQLRANLRRPGRRPDEGRGVHRDRQDQRS